MNTKFQTSQMLVDYIAESGRGVISIGYFPMPDYAGMAMYLGIVFDNATHGLVLNTEWVSLGLDLYGDTLMKSKQINFDTPDHLLDYLYHNHNLSVVDIPLAYKFDTDRFPNPIKDTDKEDVFREAWQRFLKDTAGE